MAGVVGALATIFGFMVLLARTATKVAAPHFAEAVERALEPRLEAINLELMANGGSSVKDITNRTALNVAEMSATVKQMTSQLSEFEQYQHERNHKMIGSQQALLGTMKLLHRADFERLGWDSDDLDDLIIIRDQRTHDEGPPGEEERRR